MNYVEYQNEVNRYISFLKQQGLTTSQINLELARLKDIVLSPTIIKHAVDLSIAQFNQFNQSN